MFNEVEQLDIIRILKIEQILEILNNYKNK